MAPEDNWKLENRTTLHAAALICLLIPERSLVQNSEYDSCALTSTLKIQQEDRLGYSPDMRKSQATGRPCDSILHSGA